MYEYPELSFIGQWYHGIGMFDPEVQAGKREWRWWHIPEVNALKSKSDIDKMKLCKLLEENEKKILEDRRPREC